jgi:cell division protein FtsB
LIGAKWPHFLYYSGMTVVHKGGWVRGLTSHWIIPMVLVAGLFLAFADRETGYPAWAEIREKLGKSQAKIEALTARADALRKEIRALERDPFALERAIREELELARPGEIVVRFTEESTLE